jgi:hypothetical protein
MFKPHNCTGFEKNERKNSLFKIYLSTLSYRTNNDHTMHSNKCDKQIYNVPTI